MKLWRSVRKSLEFLLGMIWDGYGSEVEVEGIWGPSVIAFHSACTDNIKFQSNSRTSRFWHHVIFKNLAFVLIWCSASPERLDGNNLFLVQALWDQCIEIHPFPAGIKIELLWMHFTVARPWPQPWSQIARWLTSVWRRIISAVMTWPRSGGWLGPRWVDVVMGVVCETKSCLAQLHSARSWLRCWRLIEPSPIWICEPASVSEASRHNGLIFFAVVLERLFEPVSKKWMCV